MIDIDIQDYNMGTILQYGCERARTHIQRRNYSTISDASCKHSTQLITANCCMCTPTRTVIPCVHPACPARTQSYICSVRTHSIFSVTERSRCTYPVLSAIFANKTVFSWHCTRVRCEQISILLAKIADKQWFCWQFWLVRAVRTYSVGTYSVGTYSAGTYSGHVQYSAVGMSLSWRTLSWW